MTLSYPCTWIHLNAFYLDQGINEETLFFFFFWSAMVCKTTEAKLPSIENRLGKLSKEQAYLCQFKG